MMGIVNNVFISIYVNFFNVCVWSLFGRIWDVEYCDKKLNLFLIVIVLFFFLIDIYRKFWLF